MITRDQLDAWLNAYGRAWEQHDNTHVDDLYSERAVYAETPFAEPMRGRDAIRQYASEAASAQEDVKFGHEVLAITGTTGIARWWSSFRRIPSGVQVRLDGIFVLDFDAAGRCERLREWWHREETPRR